MVSSPGEFSLGQILRLAGGPAAIAREAADRDVKAGKWAIYKWGKSAAVKDGYLQLLADMANLPLDVVTRANERFKDARKSGSGEGCV